MSERHPNVAKIEAATARWIEEARTKADGPALLRKRVVWLDAQTGRLSGAVDNDLATPIHLEGLAVSDLHRAQAALLVAAQDQEAAQ